MDKSGIHDRLRTARRFDPAAHVPLLCAGMRIGWLRPTAAQRLRAWPAVFKHAMTGIHIAACLADSASRTAAMDEVIRALHQEGTITGWRDERYAVCMAFDEPPLLYIERAAARFLGVTTYAAHANGWCGSGTDCEMWLARRSAAKPIDPGMLDNLVGGGMSAGVPPIETVIRESWEEAGVPKEFARNAVAHGTARILRPVPEGVQSEVIFVHDLELPCDFQPHNQDGEVAEFRRVPISDVVAMLLHDNAHITLDASLVMLSFLMRGRYVGLDRAAVAEGLTLES